MPQLKPYWETPEGLAAAKQATLDFGDMESEADIKTQMGPIGSDAINMERVTALTGGYWELKGMYVPKGAQHDPRMQERYGPLLTQSDATLEGDKVYTVGARNANFEAGESYVVFGKADGKAVNLSDFRGVGGSGGFMIIGSNYCDYSGESVSGAGDVNGDGLADVIVGAPSADPGGNFLAAGESYVVFSPVVRGDLDGDGSVGIVDLLLLLDAWGPCPERCPPFFTGDLDGDCAVGIVDFLLLLANWS